jgi:hypothetical protein
VTVLAALECSEKNVLFTAERVHEFLNKWMDNDYTDSRGNAEEHFADALWFVEFGANLKD